MNLLNSTIILVIAAFVTVLCKFGISGPRESTVACEGTSRGAVTSGEGQDECQTDRDSRIEGASDASWTEPVQLAPGDGEPWMFGQYVSISGDFAVVSATGADFSRPRCSIYFYSRQDNGSWQQTERVTFQEDADSVTCKSVAISGGRAIVGVKCTGAGRYGFGVAYILDRQGDGSWQEIARLSDADNNEFGKSVALFGEQVIVGGGGAACVFEGQGNGTWQRMATLTGDRNSMSRFAISVSIARDQALIGVDSGLFGDGSTSPLAYVFERHVDGSWRRTASLLPRERPQYSPHWTSVALSENRALVGTNWFDTNSRASGAAYVFEQQEDGSWLETATLAPEGAEDGDFMVNISLSNERAAVGAHRYTNHSKWSDAAWVFERHADGSWEESSKLAVSGADRRYTFGASVSVGGDRVIVGAPCDWEANSRHPGAAYIFECQSN